MASKIIVLTGGNKGIGKATAIALFKTTKVPLILYLTARQEALGKAAIDEIEAAGLVETAPEPSELRFYPLDITSPTSVSALASFLKEEHGHIHVLINNAGIATQGSHFDVNVVEQTVDCNYTGTKRVCEALLPLLHPKEGRIVNVSSTAGLLNGIPSEALRKRFADPKLTIGELDELMAKFRADVEKGNFESEGWPKNAYKVSKVGVTALTKVLARDHPGLLINACCPGWVKTDMAPQGIKTPAQGARTPTLLAVGDIGAVTGEFWRDERVQPW